MEGGTEQHFLTLVGSKLKKRKKGKPVIETMPSTHGIRLKGHVDHLVCGRHRAHITDSNLKTAIFLLV